MMLSSSSCKRQHPIQHHASEDRDQSRHHQYTFRGQTPCGLLLLIILVSWTGICQGAPFSSNMLRAEQELQLWNGIDDVCSAVLSDSQPAVSSGLEEICFMVMGYLQKSQGSDEKDDSKRSSVVHPLLQLVPQLHDRRMKRFNSEGVYKGPGFFSSRSASFQYKPRNGRRSSAFR
ncbi:neuromedin-U isoform X2 [Pseudophryne corroboree]|uniref:neuromedin-U isoform X2 n=1 Tax=Pseudophryne corroboree TaxID=495146 RepID=UPI0030818457